MREVERQVMLRIIDQRWREHLEEMDYLKEGINLRAMGQKDPLTEWQREGFEMFGSMMKGIAQDFVRYVMHVQVVQQPTEAPAAGPVAARRAIRAGRARHRSSDHGQPGPGSSSAPVGTRRCRAGQRPAEPADVVVGDRSRAGVPRRGERRGGRRGAGRDPAVVDADADRPGRRQRPPGNRPAKQETVVKDEWSKTPRNAPCPCGSGKKFKMCHGAS